MERRDEVRTALVFYGRWAGIATGDECLAVEHRESGDDTTRAVQAEAQRSDPGDWGCGRTETGYARGDSDEKLGLAKLQRAFAGK